MAAPAGTTPRDGRAAPRARPAYRVRARTRANRNTAHAYNATEPRQTTGRRALIPSIIDLRFVRTHTYLIRAPMRRLTLIEDGLEI